MRHVRMRLSRAVEPITPPPGVSAMKTNGAELDCAHAGPLPELLRWLAELPIADVKIEPMGLAGIYQKYHKINE